MRLLLLPGYKASQHFENEQHIPYRMGLCFFFIFFLFESIAVPAGQFVNDTACTVNAVSLTPHAYRKFRISSQIRIYMQKPLKN
jgi:hypothetical protein